MKHRLFAVAAVMTAVAGSAGAQGSISPSCAAGYTQDACQKAIDLFQYLGPQLGTLIAGGNATLGQGGPLGGFPHFRIGVRANVMNASLPEVQNVTPSITGAQRDTYTNKQQIVGLPQVDVAIGLFKGIPLPITNVGGIDLLVSASYIPSFDADNVKISGGGTQLGGGVRIGLLQESLILPGVSFTILRRDLPKVSISGNSDDDTLSVRDLKVKTTAWRVVASKSLLLFGFAAGVGQDRYNSNAGVAAYVAPRVTPVVTPGTAVGPIPVEQKLTRTNAFFDATINLPFMKIVGEVGRTSGGNITTYNNYAKDPNEARVYGSAGLRFGF